MPPHSPDSAPTHAADIAECRTMLRGGSRTFFAASLMLPRSLREPASALYAFCRLADDAVDVDGGRQDAIVGLRERLARAYEGSPLPLAADRALARVVAQFAIPRSLPEALLEGFEWDAAGRRYDDLAGLTAYAARVAGSVGAMMAILMRATSPEVVARACDLGVAMQLSNIARDVGEDARAGRIYLPLQWLRDAGIDADEWLVRPAFSEAIASVTRRVLDAAETLYARVDEGTTRLPLACRPGIHAARLLYSEIGREVARRDYDSISTRAVVPGPRKAWLLARAAASIAMPRPSPSAAQIEETRFLVDAVAGAHARASDPTASRALSLRWWNVVARAAWVVDLFERLERQDRAASIGRGA